MQRQRLPAELLAGSSRGRASGSRVEQRLARRAGSPACSSRTARRPSSAKACCSGCEPAGVGQALDRLDRDGPRTRARARGRRAPARRRAAPCRCRTRPARSRAWCRSGPGPRAAPRAASCGARRRPRALAVHASTVVRALVLAAASRSRASRLLRSLVRSLPGTQPAQEQVSERRCQVRRRPLPSGRHQTTVQLSAPSRAMAVVFASTTRKRPVLARPPGSPCGRSARRRRAA